MISPSRKSFSTKLHDDHLRQNKPPVTSGGLSRSLLRFLLLDLPLLLIFAAYIFALTLEKVHSEYLEPLKALMEWNDVRREIEVTSYHHHCNEDDITVSVADELVIGDHMSAQDAVDHMQVHGASMYPNILSNATADAVRAFIVKENLRQEGWFVIAGKNRYSFGIQVDQDPTIALALHEIAHHEVLRPALEKLVGRNPAVIEFTAITSTYGAKMQNYHQDVVAEGSAAKYARSFIPSYSLFIPLQDTTRKMGATQICPGTQMCANEPEECLEYGVSASGSRDKWPKGWGALINQQTTHRGTAHTDRFGLERVVFILTFAPRPQYALPGVIESRLLGMSGSYSLHWRHWGHTLDDFGAASQKMKEPHRTLRSLGIYKPDSADWGWDVVTVALMRMANGDNGYVRDSLEEFVDKGGFAWLPQWLQAPLDEEYYEEEGPWDGGWHDFLVGTFQKVKEALKLANQLVALIFVVGLCIASIWTTLVRKSPRMGFMVLVRNTYRVLLTHGLVLGLAWLYFTNVSKSNWARHIRNGKLFQPYGDTQITESYEIDELDTLAFTLPNKRDVLVAPHYKSRSLASYADILEFNQDGNEAWADLVATYSKGFSGLTRALQSELCEFLVLDNMLSKHRGRLLRQPEAGRWAVMSEDDAESFCYRELMMAHNPLLRAMLTEIDYLQIETKFGTWRQSAIHKSTIPSYLEAWSNNLLGPEGQDQELPPTSAQPPSVVPMEEWRQSLLLEGTLLPQISKRRSRIPSPPQGFQAPFRSAWFEMGDVVEGMYQGEQKEWYRGTVVDVSTAGGTYDVVYDDGEEDFGLCRRCVRPFRPYRMGEFVEARVDAESFERARIVAVHNEGTYDVVTFAMDDREARVYKHVPRIDLRRFA